MRRAATKRLLSTLLTPLKNPPITLRPLSSTTKPPKTDPPQSPLKPSRDSLILENFRQRKAQGSTKLTPTHQAISSAEAPETSSVSEGTSEIGHHKKTSDPTEAVSSFEELGLTEEMIEVTREMGLWAPSEIQCVGIPAILEGKSVVLSSAPGPARTLAYLLPLLQLLRRDETFSTVRPHYPRAIVLCPTEEISDEGFHVAKFITDSVRSKSRRKSVSGQSHQGEVVDAPTGMLIGTPGEVLQQMEEGSIHTDDVKYLVLNEADTMLDHNLGSKLSKIIGPLRNRKSESKNQGCQTVLVISTVRKILGEKLFHRVELLEHDNTGELTAMLLEMEHEEIFDITESPNALKEKVADAMHSLMPGS